MGNNNKKQTDEKIITYTLGPGIRSFITEEFHHAIAAYVHAHAGASVSMLQFCKPVAVRSKEVPTHIRPCYTLFSIPLIYIF